MFVPGEHSSNDLSFSVKIHTKSELEILVLAMPISAPCFSSPAFNSPDGRPVPAQAAPRSAGRPKDKFLAGDIMPIIEPISGVHAGFRKQILHEWVPARPSRSARPADLPWSPGCIGWIGSDRHER